MPSDATRLKRALTMWAAAVADEAGTRMVGYAGQDAPRKSGELAKSIRKRPLRVDGDRFTTGLQATVIQAATTDKGAKPHVIRPRPSNRRGLLVFYWPKVGHVVALPKVNHPGNRPQRWWGPMHTRRWPRALRLAARGRRL